MASTTAGKALTQDEVNEYITYLNEGATMPDKFDDVVFDNSTGKAFYRHQTTEETQASKDAIAAADKADASRTTLVNKVRTAAAKRANAATDESPPPVQPLSPPANSER